MEPDMTRVLIGIIAIIFGVIMIVYPPFVAYLVGIFLVLYGIITLISKA
ncbi:hypothetical protein [Methanobacterium congolense]|nr:hypothetical protein [Methanobacterium congolense]